MTMRAWTIGHSTRSAAEFLALLKEHEIAILADIRRFPTSRWEQFKQENLRTHLASAGIEYLHLAELGGYRAGGYETHMATEEFASGIDKLLALMAGRRTAIMCAEIVFFRCHRRFVATELVRRGAEVLHIMGPRRVQKHTATERLDVGAPKSVK